MGHVAGTTFGIGTPTTFPVQGTSWGVSPYAGQGFGAQPFPSQPYLVGRRAVPFQPQLVSW
jgi:hypothetical protein